MVARAPRGARSPSRRAGAEATSRGYEHGAGDAISRDAAEVASTCIALIASQTNMQRVRVTWGWGGGARRGDTSRRACTQREQRWSGRGALVNFRTWPCLAVPRIAIACDGRQRKRSDFQEALPRQHQCTNEAFSPAEAGDGEKSRQGCCASRQASSSPRCRHQGVAVADGVEQRAPIR